MHNISRNIEKVFMANRFTFHFRKTKIRPDSCSKSQKKKLTLSDQLLYSFISTENYSAIEIASVGQTSAHEPQSVQRSASIL
jgi:hypothetical protein